MGTSDVTEMPFLFSYQFDLEKAPFNFFLNRLHVWQYLLHHELVGGVGAAGAVGALFYFYQLGTVGPAGATGANRAVLPDM